MSNVDDRWMCSVATLPVSLLLGAIIRWIRAVTVHGTCNQMISVDQLAVRSYPTPLVLHPKTS